MMKNKHYYMQEVSPGLYLGSMKASFDIDFLHSHNITHVLSIGSFKREFPTNFVYMIVNLEDATNSKIIDHFTVTYKFIDECLDSGGRILVHCFAGISRSPTVVAAYLMKKFSLSVDEALGRIQLVRPIILPNDGFRDQLKIYEEIGYDVNIKHTAYRRFMMVGSVEELQEYGYILQPTVAPDPACRVEADDAVIAAPVECKVLKCKKCRRLLINSENMVDHSPGPGPPAFSHHQKLSFPTPSTSGPTGPCSSYFTEPMEWMGLSEGKVEGRVDCPKCGAKLGSYCWAGSQCSCGRWVVPAFMVHQSKVDLVKIRE